MEEHIVVGIRDGVATATLNRPEALNALTFAMLVRLAELLDAWESDPTVERIELRGAGDKAFCAGGDIRALYTRFKAADPTLMEFFRVEYALDHRIHTFPKPIAAIMDGIVMGGGMGIAQGARRRVVTDRTKMAMPETAIGLFPDVGGSYFLTHFCPGKVGVYLGMGGAVIRGPDCLYAGLADEYTGSATGELEKLRPAIDEHFSQRTVAAILESLKGESRPEYKPWALTTLEALAKKSPTMLVVTLEQLRRGATMTLAACFEMELVLIEASLRHGDMIEGIRALIVDKDNAPRWNPPALDQVNSARVAAFFEPR